MGMLGGLARLENSVTPVRREQTMAAAPDQAKPDKVLRRAVTVAQIMRPALTAVDRYDHVAAVAYLMKHAATSAHDHGREHRPAKRPDDHSADSGGQHHERQRRGRDHDRGPLQAPASRRGERWLGWDGRHHRRLPGTAWRGRLVQRVNGPR